MNEQAIIARYRQRTPKSEAFFARAAVSLVGGVTGSLRFFEPYPLYFAGGEGAYITDIDGNRYIDCFLCNGPLQLGHRPEAITTAIARHAATGPLVVNPMLAASVAELLVEMVPCAEQVRFLNTGTEAVMTALRCARAATGRGKVVKFSGHYHGQEDQLLVGMGRSPRPLGAGIPAASVSATVVVRYGDLAALREVLENDSDVAAVLLDPAMHAGGLWGSDTNYLRAVRALTSEKGVLLIFDEVITGFRLAPGGAQQFHNVTPDLATFAKALANGEKLGAVVGRRDIMAVLDPRQLRDQPRAYQSGTSNDGTDALAAAQASLLSYQSLAGEGAYQNLFALSERLATGLREVFSSHDIDCHINQLGPMLQLFLTAEQPSFENFIRLDTRSAWLFSLAMLKHDVLFALPGSTHVYLSFAHSEADITAVIDAAGQVLDEYDFVAISAGQDA